MKHTKYKWDLVDESTLLIIGNGFDLNLGLKTSYSDFLDSPQFEKLIQEKKTNYFALHLILQRQLEGWVDVEDEIHNYILSGDPKLEVAGEIYISKQGVSSPMHLPRNNKYRLNFIQEYIDVQNALKDYLKTQEIDSQDDLSKSAAFQLISKLGNIQNLYVIDFNYTLTFEALLSKEYVSDNKVYNNVLHIHGSLRKENDIVFGVQDDLKEEEQLLPKYVRVYKSSSPYTNANGVNDLFDKCRHIIFFGYSLGETDSSYFKDFFRNLSKKNVISEKEIDIFYYNDDELDKINNRIRDLADGHVLDIRRNHNVSLIPVNELDNVYTRPIVKPNKRQESARYL
jgi:hypothetical protein